MSPARHILLEPVPQMTVPSGVHLFAPVFEKLAQ